MNIVDSVAKLSVEGKNSLVVLSNAETYLRASPFNEKSFSTSHQFGAETGPLMLRGDSQGVDASAMPVVADHD